MKNEEVLDFHTKDVHLLQKHLDALRKTITILNYPTELLHEVRKGWPELQLLLRGIQHYFSTVLPEHFQKEERLLFSKLSGKVSPSGEALLQRLHDEHRGLLSLASSMLNLIRDWTHSSRIPSRAEVFRLESLYHELRLHLEKHESLEEERLIPLATRTLSARDLDELRETPPLRIKRGA